jgi:phenylalanyl-tRNA synthetase beta chain
VHGVIVAQVLTIEELTGFKKPIRYCRVATSDAELTADPATVTGVICGATNFKAGDRVAFATPGATLPGGFEITAAKKYGRISAGMICAVDELGIGEDHSGILILPPDTPLGVDFAEYAQLRDDVLDITVTPDRGYAVSIRGVARELASAYRVPYTDPASTFVPGEDASGLPADDTADTAVDARPARPLRPALGLAGGRRHQLPDARARPAAARLRSRQAQRADRRAPGAAR